MLKESGCNDTSIFLTADPVSFFFFLIFVLGGRMRLQRNDEPEWLPLMVESRSFDSEGIAEPTPLVLNRFPVVQTFHQFLI